MLFDKKDTKYKVTHAKANFVANAVNKITKTTSQLTLTLSITHRHHFCRLQHETITGPQALSWETSAKTETNISYYKCT